MFKFMEFYLQNKCALASSNPRNKNKVCPEFLSYGVIGISQKNSTQPPEREVSYLQIYLSSFTALLALKILILRELPLFARFPFKEQRTLHRQHLKLIKWRIKDKTGHSDIQRNKAWKK